MSINELESEQKDWALSMLCRSGVLSPCRHHEGVYVDEGIDIFGMHVGGYEGRNIFFKLEDGSLWITYNGEMIRFRKYSVSCWKGYGRIDIFLKKYRNKHVEVTIFLNENDALKDSDIRRYILKKILRNFLDDQKGNVVTFSFRKIIFYARRKFHLSIDKWYKEFSDIVIDEAKPFIVERYIYGGQLRRSKYKVVKKRKYFMGFLSM